MTHASICALLLDTVIPFIPGEGLRNAVRVLVNVILYNEELASDHLKQITVALAQRDFKLVYAALSLPKREATRLNHSEHEGGFSNWLRDVMDQLLLSV